MSAKKSQTKIDSAFDESREDDDLNRRLKQKIVIGDRLKQKFDQHAASGKFEQKIDQEREALKAKREKKTEESRQA